VKTACAMQSLFNIRLKIIGRQWEAMFAENKELMSNEVVTDIGVETGRGDTPTIVG
jgi:hypothetical protein